jgi:hypothetical protein
VSCTNHKIDDEWGVPYSAIVPCEQCMVMDGAICYNFHTCQMCHQMTLCWTYRWACPFINGDEDMLCDSCLAVVADEMERWME